MFDDMGDVFGVEKGMRFVQIVFAVMTAVGLLVGLTGSAIGRGHEARAAHAKHEEPGRKPVPHAPMPRR